MISLDQVRLLEQKVEKAVSKILQLQKENAELKERCAFLESKAENLNKKVSDFESDQNKIEEGIANALQRLNMIEDSVRSAIELDSSNNPAISEDSAVFEESIPETVESSDSFIPTEIQEDISNQSSENDFQLEIPENQFEDSNQETVIDIPKDDSVLNSFNFDEPTFEMEQNQQNSNQFDIF